MREHWNNNSNKNIHLEMLNRRTRYNLGKMFSVPKSKSPWDAMTEGSTGGWAKGLQSWGPAIQLAQAAAMAGTPLAPFIPAMMIGEGMGGMSGKGTGFQGTDKGSANWASTALGGLAGYGMGGLGAGLGGGIGSLMSGGGLSGAGSAFMSGMGKYAGTNIIPGMAGSNPTAWLGGANAVPTQYGNMMDPYGTSAGGIGTDIGTGAEAGGGAASSTPGLMGSSSSGFGAARGGTPGFQVGFDGSGFSPFAGGPPGTEGFGANVMNGANSNVAQSLAMGGGAQEGANGANGGGGLLSGMGGMQKLGLALAGGSAIASLGSKAPTFDYQNAGQRVGQSQDLLQKYLGDSAMQLPSAASDEYLKQIQSPLGQLYPAELDAQWGRLQPMIDKSWDNYDKALDAQYAASGGIGSTDYQKAKANSQNLRSQELSQSYQEIQANVFQKQVAVKQQALQAAAQQGNFDMNTAMELAQMSGQDQNLQMALQTGNYQQFQTIMSQLMFQGFTLANPQKYNIGTPGLSLSLNPTTAGLMGAGH